MTLSGVGETLASAPLRPLGWLWWLLLPVLLPRRREAWALAALALAIRLLFDPDRILMAIDYAGQRLRAAWGLDTPHYFYGDGWATVHAPIWRLLGRPAQVARDTNLVLSALTPVLLARWLLRRRGDERVAWAAGLMLALLPLAAGMARTEDHFVTVAFLQVAAVSGLASPWWVERVAGGLSLGLAAHTRPDQALFALLVLGVAAARRRWDFVGVGAALVGWRLVVLARGLDEGIADSWVREPAGWGLGRLVGPDSGLALFDPGRVPVALAALVLVGVVTARARPTSWFALAAALVTGLPFVNLGAPTDVVRFQLPALTWWCVLAAEGAVALGGDGRLRRLGVAAALVVTGWWARRPLGPLPHWAVEHRVVEAAAGVLPPGAVVRYDGVWCPSGHFRSVAEAITGARWVPLSEGPVVAGEWWWTGRAALYPGASAPPACTLAPPALEVVAEVHPDARFVEPVTAPTVRIALSRVLACP